MDNSELKKRHEKLTNLVKKYLAAKTAYFKSNKDVQLLKVSKALEKQLDDFVNPKPMSQAEFEWLAQ